MFYKGNEDREKRLRFSIRKVSFGAASVAVAALFMFPGNGTVSATEPSVTLNASEKEILNLPSDETKDKNYQNGVNAKDIVTTNHEGAVGNSTATESKSTEVEILNKESLTKLIEEIDGKFTNGKYASKTEDSVQQLKVALEEARTVLSNAKTQEELTRAYNKLVTATTQLKTKPEEKKEAPAVDTTNGKATVGIKATNTEKTTETNSIAHSGSRDERNGKALNTNNPFRTDATTTNDDPSANQTYTAPAENADLGTLVEKLKGLDSTVENNTKLSQNMDSLGDSKKVAKGAVKEITEFGGWKAVDGGKFVIARKTEAGVYPLETINSTLNDTVWLQEQALDRRTEYTLLLSKSITRANQKEAAWDSSVYRPTGVASGVTKNVAGYNGIEKTFTAYSTLYGSDVVVKFKPGYVGDSDGFKANYKVQVYSITGNQEKLVYETTFDPSKDANDDKKIVTKATDGKNKVSIRISKTPNRTTIDGGVDHTKRVDFIEKSAAEKLMAQPGNKPNGAAGTFTSKPIALPKGADHYKVRISLADQNRTGMSYQAWDEKYSLPVTGLDFSIAQDTSNVAKNLLQRIYDKLKATETADTDGKTNETKAAYLAELENIKTLVTSTDVKKTAEYKEALESTLSKQLALRVDKTGLTESKTLLDGLVNEDPTPGKTQDTATAYNAAKQEAIKVIEAAKTVIDNENATVAEVRDALATVNAKKTALQKAKDGLIEAATADEKAKLKADSEALKKADTTGKTPNSIDKYNEEFKKFEQDYNSIKTEVSNIIAKGNNATKAEVDTALSKVAEIKRKLDTAAGLLVNKGNKTELEKAVREESTVKGNFKYYNANKNNKNAYDSAITKGKDVINNPNATQAQVDAALTAITEAKQALNGAETNKEELRKASTTDAETTKTTDAKYYNGTAEKKEAYDNAVKAAAEVINNPNATQAQVDAALTAITEAKQALNGALTDKEQLINTTDALNNLILEDSTKGKTKATIDEYKKVQEESEKVLKEVKKVIDNKNASQIEVNKALELAIQAKDALEIAKKSLLDAVEAREVVETTANEKIASIKADKKLFDEEKQKALDTVEALKEKALEAINNSTKQSDLDKALRTFLYQVDQDALVADLPELKLEDALKALINGVVKVERGTALSQADVLAKLDLPEEISVIKMVLPDTNTVGTKVATVTLRLADGSVQKLEVPVEVISPKNQNIIPPYNGGNDGPSADNGTTNTDAKVNKSKLESAIHQLDELIIQESAKLDAETAKEANALSADAKKVFANVDASQAEVDTMVKRIEDFMAKVSPAADHVTPAEDQASQTPAVAPATTQAAANASQEAATNVRKASKELPNTGTADSTVAMVAAAASALLGLGLAGRRRKEDEEA
ncbi:YSIRK-type signal peptide-containing protein [Streptococcus sp. 3851]|uniref:YSIRK-type signal peptide-containing protein n=1 Tax=Streptococcus sp. 3851 TaxID=2582663 RepID=UPI001564A4F4|nr:YSIRK-type signal peptide-containing protein [Streptococcus sp. 3851]